MAKRAKLAFQPQCGDFTSKTTAERVTGVMIMKGAPAGGQWWVGGEQKALVVWRDGSQQDQRRLYNYVRRAIVAHGERAVEFLVNDAFVSVAWFDKEETLGVK